MKRGDIPSMAGLTSFVAAAQHGSFTRAASELNLTQGAISRQIREIEIHLGTQLFARVRQRVVLTDAGRIYLSHVKKALDDLADGAQRATSIANNAVLNLVALPTFGMRWLVPRLPDFHKRHPSAMIQVTTLLSPIDFTVAPFDAAVYHSAPQWPGTISHFLLDADFVPVCSPKLNAKRAIKSPADILKFPLLHKSSRPNRWAIWLSQAGVVLDRPLHGHACENFAMIAQAAVAGLGLALLPRYLVEDEIADKRLETIADGLVEHTISYYLILPEARASTPPVHAFATWLIEEAAKFQANRELRQKAQRVGHANARHRAEAAMLSARQRNFA